MSDEIVLDAHNFLKACYLNQDLPVDKRIKAAQICIGYERPKLSSVVSHTFTTNMSIGAQLTRASERIREHRRALVEAGLSPEMAKRMPYLELKAEPQEQEKSEACSTSLPVLGLRRRGL